MLFDKTIFIQTAATNWCFFLHNKMELTAIKMNPQYLFCQTYKIFFNLYVFIRKNTYFYIFKRDVLGFSIYKEFQ